MYTPLLLPRPAPTANLLLCQSHSADQARSSPSRTDWDPSQPAQGDRQSLSLLLTLPHQKALSSPGLVYQVSKARRHTIGTWVAGTPVHFLLTVGAGEVGRAFTGIAGPLGALPAGAPIEARGVGTAQGAVFAVQAIVAWGTQAVVAILLVLERDQKGAKVRGWEAEMYSLGLGPTCPPCLSMATWGGDAWAPPGQTSAFLRWPGPHLTAASIATGVAVTLAELQLTVHTGVAWAAGAGVAPLPTVRACCPILARGVMGAIVEICRDRNPPAEQSQKIIPTSRLLAVQVHCPCWPRGFNSVFQVQIPSLLPSEITSIEAP